MRDNRHYSCRITNPARSRYAFLTTGFAISGAEVPVPRWLGPIEITQDMTAVQKAFWERHNPSLSLVENDFRKSAIEHLRRGGVPESNLVTPLKSDVEKLVALLVRSERRANWYREQLEPDEDTYRRDRPFDGQNVDRELCARVIGTALIARTGRGHEATAKYLNEGLAPGTQGLDRHHVIRAFAALKRTWKRSPRSGGLLYVLADCDLLDALDIVYTQARQHPKFSKYQGADLAWAIHEDFDLNERIHRADKWLRAKRLTAV
jgi:hypothetical protein